MGSQQPRVRGWGLPSSLPHVVAMAKPPRGANTPVSPARDECEGCWGAWMDAGVHGMGATQGRARGGRCQGARQQRAEQEGSWGWDWILLGRAKPIDPAVIKVAPKPDSYSTLGGRSFSEKRPPLPVRLPSTGWPSWGCPGTALSPRCLLPGQQHPVEQCPGWCPQHRAAPE